jgi:hypothetical protein
LSNQLTPNSGISLASTIAKNDGTKAASVGIGEVGMACAYSMLIQNI